MQRSGSNPFLNKQEIRIAQHPTLLTRIECLEREPCAPQRMLPLFRREACVVALRDRRNRHAGNDAAFSRDAHPSVFAARRFVRVDPTSNRLTECAEEFLGCALLRGGCARGGSQRARKAKASRQGSCATFHSYRRARLTTACCKSAAASVRDDEAGRGGAPRAA
jgi:hypothetical protein